MRAEKPEAIEPGAREHGGVDHALGHLAQPRVDVAAQDLDVEIGARRAHLADAPQAGGADAAARRQRRRAARRRG